MLSIDMVEIGATGRYIPPEGVLWAYGSWYTCGSTYILISVDVSLYMSITKVS